MTGTPRLNRKTNGEMADKPLSRKKFLLCGLSVLVS